MRTVVERYAINILVRDDGAILFLKRAADRSMGARQWGFPAGRIEPEETPLAAADRELEEECGRLGTRHVRRLGPLYFGCADGRPAEEGRCIEVHLFQRAYTGGLIALNEEHTAACWLSPAEAAHYDLMRGAMTDLRLLGLE